MYDSQYPNLCFLMKDNNGWAHQLENRTTTLKLCPGSPQIVITEWLDLYYQNIKVFQIWYQPKQQYNFWHFSVVSVIAL